ncbi:MAG: PHP domain-containing protein [Longimicrobiales bacterium]
MRIDLHIHSNASDGALAPSEVVTRAADAGLDLIALADHDTTAGVAPARAAAADRDIQVLSAIEISASHRDRDIHILGYQVDPDAPILAEHSTEARARRDIRIRKMIERLEELGVGVEYEAVVEEAGPNAQALARPHLARVLWNQGHVSSVAQAFDRYIADDGPAYVAVHALDVAGAIERVHQAGGIAVWAHPPMPLLGGALDEFVGAGLDGIECYRPRVAPPELSRLLNKARQHGLLVTGGSDWHGDWHGDLGSFYLDPDVLDDFLDRVGI